MTKTCENCYHRTFCEKSKGCSWCGTWMDRAEFIRQCARQDVLTGKDRDGLEHLADEMEGEQK